MRIGSRSDELPICSVSGPYQLPIVIGGDTGGHILPTDIIIEDPKAGLEKTPNKTAEPQLRNQGVMMFIHNTFTM